MDTSPEVRLRSALWRRGLRYRLHVRVGRVRPDIVFRHARVLVFVDGCFWHGCPEHYVCPRSRQEFWSVKLSANVARDRAQTRELEDAGWKVIRVWEHDVFDSLEAVVDGLDAVIGGASADRGPSWRVTRVELRGGHGEFEERRLVSLRDPPNFSVIRCARTTRKWKTRTRSAELKR